MSNPLVTIITPTYNHEHYIIDCIRSAQEQTYEQWEMIIINDGSTDGTAQKIEEYIVSEPRVRLVNQANKGIFRLAENYNTAMELSNGKYIGILEGDDVWSSDKLSRQVAAMEEDPTIVIAWGCAETANEDLSIRHELHPKDRSDDRVRYYNNLEDHSILNLLLLENCIPALTMLIRSDALKAIGNFRQPFHLPLVDLPTIMELSQKGRFYFDDHHYGIWRFYAHQVTKTYPVEIIIGRYNLSKHVFNHLSPEFRKHISVGREQIDAHFNQLLLIGYARSGRYRLIRKQFSEARKDYAKAMFYKGFSYPVWRLRALVGYAFSLLRLDVESLARLMGKRTYK